jgi:prepilin-type N-terminal cleavage/methylation domain-containing protein/prepilin-type processing-associated H-X9-DG protein
MNLRKAFTLIELLVVIAIIAILAAILFPVFAQAKLMAKAAASESNIKQIAMAQLMYATDNDDFSCPETGWSNWSFPVWFGGVPPQTYMGPWTWLELPYTKSMQLNQDPCGPLFYPTQPGWSYNAQQCLNPSYGYDYCVLSAYDQANGDATSYQHTIPQNQINKPAATVMFHSKGYMITEWSPDINEPFWCWLWNGQPLPGFTLLNAAVDPPVCSPIPAWCGTDWGTQGVFSGYTSVWYGANTGQASARAPVNQDGTTAFCDGHVKKLSYAQDAVGTNWGPTQVWTSLALTSGPNYMWFINYNFGF